MTAKEALAFAVAEHNKWLADNSTGTRLDLTWANLSGANLTGAYLSRANLTWSDLSGADLSGAIGLPKEKP
jgi:uncharacterized protein YjbI with pentapeptide repeats